MRTWALPLDGVRGDVAVAAGCPAGMSGRESTLGVLVEDDAMDGNNYTPKKACFIFIPPNKHKKERRGGGRGGSWSAANQPKADARRRTGTMGVHSWSGSKIRDYRC